MSMIRKMKVKIKQNEGTGEKEYGILFVQKVIPKRSR